MNKSIPIAVACTLVVLNAPATCHAALSADPVLSFGVLGSYSELDFKGQGSTQTERMPEGGLFLNYGNKMTAHDGLFYLAEITGQYSEKQGQKVEDSQVDLDLGWRMALDSSNFVDGLLGAGYKWNRFDPGYHKYDVDLTSRTPFVKAAAGYNHLFSDATFRVEVGVRQSIQGDAQLNIHGVDNERQDLKDSTDPYIELSLLFNQQGDLPIIAMVYYNRFNYDLDGQFTHSDYDKQVRDEIGGKLGMVF
jgi:hypothetical protein